MGCSASKTVSVREQSNLSHHSNVSSTSSRHPTTRKSSAKSDIQSPEPPLNIFPDAPNDDGDTTPLCDNAKPRLRSAIRRNTNAQRQGPIKPVVDYSSKEEIDDYPEYSVISIGSSSSNSNSNNNNNHNVNNNSSNIIISESSRNSDSGFGTTSAFSDNAERSKSTINSSPHGQLRDRTPSFGVKRSDTLSSRPDSGKTGSILTTGALNASFMTSATGDDDFNFNNSVDVTLDLQTPFSEYTDVDLENTFRTASITPVNTPSTFGATPVELTPVMHNKHIGVIQEESEGGFTPRSIDCFETNSVNNHTTNNNNNNNNNNNMKNTHHAVSVHDSETMENTTTAEKSPVVVVQNGYSNLPTYLPREIMSHNKQAGSREWTTYKGKVYDTKLTIATFGPIVAHHVECRRIQESDDLNRALPHGGSRSNSVGNGDHRKHDIEIQINGENLDEEEECISCSSEDDDCPQENGINLRLVNYGKEFEHQQTWNRLGITALLRLELASDVLAQHLQECCLGEVAGPSSSRYWDDVRHDVRTVLDHLNRCDARDELSVNEVELKEQLQGWMSQHRDFHPRGTQQPEGDPNQTSFPLPIRTCENPDSLRKWLENFVSLDMDVPESGAWVRYEVEEIDLGDPDVIFQATLRSDGEHFSPLDFEINGEAAWCVLPVDLVAGDIMTQEQEAVDRSRQNRSDLHDPKRMARRRTRLMNYFVSKYELRDVEHFSRWAVAMDEGDRKFKELCGLIS